MKSQSCMMPRTGLKLSVGGGWVVMVVVVQSHNHFNPTSIVVKLGLDDVVVGFVTISFPRIVHERS